MSKIANKHGLTKKYRDPSISYTGPKRGRKKSILGAAIISKCRYSYANNAVPSDKPQEMPKGCIVGIVVFLLLIVLVVAGVGNKSPNKTTDSDTEVNATTMPTQPDLTAYDGDPGISGNVYIEKEYDSWVLEITGSCKNNSKKAIKKLTLYLVCCENNATPMESSEYAKHYSIENLGAGKKQEIDWTSGTTTYGDKEFFVYVGYILYEDGSEWGTENINHSAVVTRGITLPNTFQEIEEAS